VDLKEIGMNKGINTVGDGWNGYPITPIRLKKEWVGLTDEEYFILQMKIKTPMVSVGDYINAMQMVEEKLKEKNGF